MTKDEAWKAHVEEYDRDRFDSTSRHRRHCFDAGWDAALADTLGMLERAAERLQTTVSLRKPLLWVKLVKAGFRYISPDFPNHGSGTRAEAEALLGEGKEEKG